MEHAHSLCRWCKPKSRANSGKSTEQHVETVVNIACMIYIDTAEQFKIKMFEYKYEKYCLCLTELFATNCCKNKKHTMRGVNETEQQSCGTNYYATT